MTQREEENIAFFQKVGALVTGGHFVGTRPRHLHMTDYVNKRAVYPYVTELRSLCEQIARPFPAGVDVVVGIGNAILAHTLARALMAQNGRHSVVAVHAEKDPGGGSRFPDEYLGLLGHDKDVIIVEDVLHTGGTVKEVIQLVDCHGPRVLGVGALWNRGGVTDEELEVPMLHAAINRRLPSWTKEECENSGPCSRGVVVNPYLGHGREFRARQRQKK